MPPVAKIFYERGGANRPAHPSVLVLSLGVAALILFGSLYPFGMQLPNDQSIWNVILHAIGELQWARAGRGDRIGNVLLYLPFGFCVFLYLDGRIQRARAAWLVVLIGAVLSLGVELSQAYIPVRVSSYWDWTFNTLGTLLGVIGAMAWRAFSVRLATEPSSNDSVALLGLCAWIAWRWAPFDLHVGLQAFKAALQPVSDPHIHLTQTLQYLVWWLMVAELLFAWANRTRATENLLSAMAITLAGRFFFVDTPIQPSELLAMVLVLPVLVLLHRLHSTPRQWLIVTAFVGNYLFIVWSTPLATDFAAHSGFDWWPFIRWIQQGLIIDIAWLSQQLFVLICVAWLLLRLNVASKAAIYWLTGGAILLEAVKATTLGGSITLPVIAFATSGLIHLLQPRTQHRFRV